MKLQVDNELKKIIPPLTLEEFAILEKNILENGIQDSIKTWQGIIIDGHNRYEIACKHSILYDTKEIKFDNRQDVIEWMLNNQLGRRNLSVYDRSLIALKLEEMYKLNVKEKEKVRKINNDFDNIVEVAKGKNDTRKELSKKADISEGTLNKVKHIEQKATPEVKEKLKKGEMTINKAFQDIKKEERKRENEQKIKEAASKKNNSNIKILEGNLFNLIGEIEDNSIDLFGYANKFETDYDRFWIINVAKLRTRLMNYYSLQDLENKFLKYNKPPAKANFFAIPFKILEDMQDVIVYTKKC